MTFHHPLPTLGRKLVNDFFHLRQFLKPLPLLTLLDLASALGPINRTLLETLSLALCCMYVKSKDCGIHRPEFEWPSDTF